jgi:dihydroorotate dehydrogenase
MDWYGRLARPLAFHFDAEWVHERALDLIAAGLMRGGRREDPRLKQTLFGTVFANPLGLAAGFDKNARAIRRWPGFGFGFAEIGTVTAHAQPGNPRPRLFRLAEDDALINRLGFNNAGAEAVTRNMAARLDGFPLGVNLGKSRVVELADAPADYARSFRLLKSQGDYFVINVSSPNTPGLRSLQERGPLSDIIDALFEVDRTRPLFVKVSPDLTLEALDDVISLAHEKGLAGIIATNTTVDRTGLRSPIQEQGGLSGRPLREKSNGLLAHLFGSCERAMVLIGVGGVFDGDDLVQKISLGAHLVQTYTGWVYGGPHMPSRAIGGLIEAMERDGLTHLSELRGRAAASISA